MEAITELTTINYLSVLLGVLVIMFGVKEIIEIFTYFKKKFRIKTGIESDRETLEERISTLEKHDEWQYEEITKISNGVDEIKKQLLDKDIEDIRGTILDFGTNLSNGKKYNKEAFDRIIRLYAKYEKLLEQNHMVNGLIAETMKYIMEVYHEKLRTGF